MVLAVGRVGFGVENVLAAKPSIVNKIVLLVANPGGCKNFGLVGNALLLYLAAFFGSRLNQVAACARNERVQNRLVVAVARPQRLVVVCCPNNVPLLFIVMADGMVFEQGFKYLWRQFENVILENVDCFCHICASGCALLFSLF